MSKITIKKILEIFCRKLLAKAEMPEIAPVDNTYTGVSTIETGAGGCAQNPFPQYWSVSHKVVLSLAQVRIVSLHRLLQNAFPRQGSTFANL